jgi:hypothetical protein
MVYFTQVHHNGTLGIASDNPPSLEHIHQRFAELHRRLQPRLTQHAIQLIPGPSAEQGIDTLTLCTPFPVDAMTLIYTRDAQQAALVEQTMGREGAGSLLPIETKHHAVIELRLTLTHFAVELVIAPSAWYDQQNLVGKLSLKPHQYEFYDMLKKLPTQYRLGFWSGIQPGEMSLEINKLPPRSVMLEYLSTFAPGNDWFRLGFWYEPEDPALTVDAIFSHMRDLYEVFKFLAWNSENNYHTFYNKLSSDA